MNSQEPIFSDHLSIGEVDLFAADWHPHLGERLAVFPRCIRLPRGIGDGAFWPDLATFIEDDERRLLMYYAAGTPWSLEAQYSKREGALGARLYWESEMVWRERGVD